MTNEYKNSLAVIHKLIAMAEHSKHSEAMQYTQAALNAANALDRIREITPKMVA